MNLNCHLKLRYSHCLNLQSNNESNRYCEAKKVFDSVYALKKTKNRQWIHIMLCVNVADNETHNYRTYQSLFDFLKLTISPINKEPVRNLNKRTIVTAKSIRFI